MTKEEAQGHKAGEEAQKRRADDLEAALERIILQHVPALLRDAREPDKVDCYAQAIRGEVVRALPGRNYP